MGFALVIVDNTWMIIIALNFGIGLGKASSWHTACFDLVGLLMFQVNIVIFVLKP